MIDKFERPDARILRHSRNIPVDHYNPDEAKNAKEYTLPDNLCIEAKIIWQYFGSGYSTGTMFIFSYQDKLVLTDESLELMDYEYTGMLGNTVYGEPRGTFDTWEQLEKFLKAVYQEFVDIDAFNDTRELYDNK